MSALTGVRAIAFDAYGTLYDVHSVVELAQSLYPGHGEELSRLWRGRQLEYTWLQTLMQAREDFASVTRRALGYAIAALGLPAEPARIEALLAQYLRLAPFPEAREALAALAPRRLFILSNGTRAMLDPLVAHSGFDSILEGVLSVDAVNAFKPAPAVYLNAAATIGVRPDELALVSSNGWDAIGAKSAGLRAVWVNRTGLPLDTHGPAPDRIVSRLSDLRSVFA